MSNTNFQEFLFKESVSNVFMLIQCKNFIDENFVLHKKIKANLYKRLLV